MKYLMNKFIKNESTNRTISNLVGNMKIVEDYAQRIAQKKVDENNEKTIINLNKKGFKSEEIAETIKVSIDFVNKVLAK